MREASGALAVQPWEEAEDGVPFLGASSVSYGYVAATIFPHSRCQDESGRRKHRGGASNRSQPPSLGLTTSLVEGGATDRAALYRGLERFRLSVALMWSSPSGGATGGFLRPASRTPFGVDGPTIWGRATGARTARRLWPHSTTWQYGPGCQNGCTQLRHALVPSLRPRFARALRKGTPRYRVADRCRWRSTASAL